MYDSSSSFCHVKKRTSETMPYVQLNPLLKNKQSVKATFLSHPNVKIPENSNVLCNYRHSHVVVVAFFLEISMQNKDIRETELSGRF